MNKDAISSRTIYGILALILGPFLARWGIDEVLLQGVAEGVALLIGAGVTFWGRQHASGPITTLAGAKLPAALVPETTETTENLKP